jgi:hypothetical protein
MTKAELDEQIGKLTRQESEKKDIAESSFKRLRHQMMPDEMAKRFLKNGVTKSRSFLPHCSSESKPKHG